MYQIQPTEVFSKWLAGLRNAKGTARILARLDSVRLGNLGDSKSLGGGLHQMRIFAGPGYRLYFAPRGEIVIVLLCGGDKSSQQRDIARQAPARGIGVKTMVKLKEFDPSVYLTNDEVVAEYLTAALEDSNPDVFLAAVGNVAKARGMSSIAEGSGLGRESLYKALTPGAKPRYDTVLKVLQSLGVKLTVSAA